MTVIDVRTNDVVAEYNAARGWTHSWCDGISWTFIHTIAESGIEAPWRLEILADRHPEVTFVALDGFAK